MPKMPNLEDAYALTDLDAVKTLYAQWAVSYDAGFGDAMGYQLPREVAFAFAGMGGHGPVLDVGAGTGLVGAYLAGLNIAPVDALDLSKEMLAVAAEKKIYRDLIAANFLETGNAIPFGEYKGIVSAGTFTHGHVGPEGLEPLIGLLANGGMAAISVNRDFFETGGFSSKIAALETKSLSFDTRDVRIYDDRAEAAHRDDLARVLLVRKA